MDNTRLYDEGTLYADLDWRTSREAYAVFDRPRPEAPGRLLFSWGSFETIAEAQEAILLYFARYHVEA